MDRVRQEKVQRFEEFVDRRLKPDLVRAIAERDKVFEQQKTLFSSDLRRNIENLEKNSVTNLRTLVNLGSEVYMQADVPDTRHICVDVGLGFHVEFTWPEALNYISAREERLARQIEDYTRLIALIKAQIKMFDLENVGGKFDFTCLSFGIKMMDQDEPQLARSLTTIISGLRRNMGVTRTSSIGLYFVLRSLDERRED